MNVRFTILAKYFIVPLIFITLTGCPIPGLLPIVSVVGLGHIPFEVLTQNIPTNTDAYITLANDSSILIDRYYNNNYTITVGGNPSGIALWQAGHRLYVINNAGLSISVISISPILNGSQVIASISDPAFHHMGDAVVTQDGSSLYVATDTNAISVISTTANTVLQTITDPGFNYPAHLIADVYGRYIFVSEGAGNAVSIISTTTNTVIQTIGVGVSPNGMAQTSDGKWLFVVNSGSDSITVINVDSLAIVRTVTDPGFDNPQRIILDPNCAHAYISEYNTGTISSVSENALIYGTGQVVAWAAYVGKNPYDLGIVPAGYSINVLPGTSFTDNEGTAYVVVGLQGDRAIAYVDLGWKHACD